MRLYFRDVLDHAVRVNESTDTLREMLTAAMSVNLSLVTIAPGRGGQAPRRLGRAAGGADADRQLVRHELRAHAGTGGRYSYAMLIGVVVVVCVGLYAYLKKVRWL